MTDYPAKSTSWRKRQIHQKWRSLLAIFITTVLFFALLNGFAKTFSIKKYLGESQWDGKASFSVVLTTEPVSIVVYQTDPARIAFFKLSGDRFLESGNTAKPLVKLSEIVAKGDGKDLARVLSLAFGADIEKYATLTGKRNLDKESTVSLFKKFASLVTPAAILTGGIRADVLDTNITRFDLIRLWWQLKGLSIDKVQMVDLSPYTEEIVTTGDQKVLGVDEVSLHMQITKFLENRQISEGNLIIQNASGRAVAGQLAAEFVSSVGFTAGEVRTQNSPLDETIVITDDKNSYAASYLAKIFDCDIKAVPKEDFGGPIVVIGRNFAARYFQ